MVWDWFGLRYGIRIHTAEPCPFARAHCSVSWLAFIPLHRCPGWLAFLAGWPPNEHGLPGVVGRHHLGGEWPAAGYGGTAKLGSRGGGPSNTSVFVRFPLASPEFPHTHTIPSSRARWFVSAWYGPVSWVSWVRCRVGVASFVPRLASRGTPSVGIGRLFQLRGIAARSGWHTAGTAGRVGLRASVSAGWGIIISCRRPVPDTGGWLSWVGGLEGCLLVS